MKDLTYIIELVKKLRNQDAMAMQGLFELFSREMMATSFRITNSKADSEDILQDTFIRSFQKIKQLTEDKLYGAWLKRMVINDSLRLVKMRKYFQDIEHLEIADVHDHHSVYESIPFDIIKRAIQNLPDGSRVVFSLYLLEGYKHKEIAEELNISISTSKSQYRYALKLLREQFVQKLYG